MSKRYSQILFIDIIIIINKYIKYLSMSQKVIKMNTQKMRVEDRRQNDILKTK